MCRLLIIVILVFFPIFVVGQTSQKNLRGEKQHKLAASKLRLVFGTIWDSYGRTTRDKDFDKFADIFTENAMIVFSTAAETVKGRSKIKEFARTLYADIQAKGIVVEGDDLQFSGQLAIQTGVGSARQAALAERESRSDTRQAVAEQPPAQQQYAQNQFAPQR